MIETREHRSCPLEVRSKGRTLEGHAAVFGQAARIGGFTESIRAGAFASTLRSAGDILALVDHDAGKLLARTKSGTLRLAEDGQGLAFALDVPDTQTGRDILALAERGDLGGASFGFTVPKGGDAWTGTTRELRSVTLHEISIVLGWPAYAGTNVAARSLAHGVTLRARLAATWLQTHGGRA